MFSPRTFETIYADMEAFVRMQTTLTDFEVGSVIRTILEAAALEDDEQYFQMVQLLDAFKLSTAAGQDLDDRVEEFGLIRLQPASSGGTIVVTDQALTTDELAFNYATGATTVVLEDSSDFPTAPFQMRVGEGTVSVEDVGVIANNTSTNTLTLSIGFVNDHDAGERASVVTGSGDRTISPGVRVQVPAAGENQSIIFITVEAGTLVNGDFRSTAIRARAEVPGSNSNITSAKITEFVSSPPFDGAGVTNLSNFAGGRDLETDARLRDRARAKIQSLSRGTVLALKEGVLGVADEVTGQRVTTSNILESFVDNIVSVYVDDGTGFTPDQVNMARDEVAVGVAVTDTTVEVVDASEFPSEGFILISPENAAQTEVIEYSGVDYTTNIITFVTPAAKVHDIGDEVALIDVIADAAEAGTNFFQTGQIPLVPSSYRLWLDDGGVGSPVLLEEDVDYNINRATGQIEMIGTGVLADSVLVANYNYYTGLLATVQKVIDGDPDDPVNYPGIRAAGIRAFATTPTIRRITVRASIVAIPGVQESDLVPLVIEAIENYINSLGIGENVIISEIIQRAMNVSGMLDVSVTLPTSNVIILENELPRPLAVDGSSLVDVV